MLLRACLKLHANHLRGAYVTKVEVGRIQRCNALAAAYSDARG